MYNAFKVYTIPVLKSILALFIYSHLLSMVLDSVHSNHQAQCLAVACISVSLLGSYSFPYSRLYEESKG